VNPETVSGLKPVRRALLSVTDKSGLIAFAQALAAHQVELISTGGTAKALRDAGLEVRDISDLTGFPEMLDGRVKTLHPKVHGGILHIRDNPSHVAAVQAHEIQPIDIVVVNLYAFEKTARKSGVTPAEIIENIDIGGPSMVRSAAKNFEDVTIVTSVHDYDALAGASRNRPSPSLPPTTRPSPPRSKPSSPRPTRTTMPPSSTPPRSPRPSASSSRSPRSSAMARILTSKPLYI